MLSPLSNAVETTASGNGTPKRLGVAVVRQISAYHHNCKKKSDLVRPEDLTEVPAKAVAELLKHIISRELMARHISARSGAIGLLRTPNFLL